MPKNHIYPEQIRRFEKEIIDFIVASGKNKRSSEIESHILAYFFCHPTLTQQQIQEISALFRDKKISKGSISNFLNLYESYGVIVKSKNPESAGAFKYALKDRSIQVLMATGLEAGREKLHNWIQYIEERVQALSEIAPTPKSIGIHAILMERLGELRDFLVFHDNLMNSFFSGKFEGEKDPEISVSNERIAEIKKKSIREIEEEIVQLLEENPLFMIEEVKYRPIFSYLITRKRLTQSRLQKLTGLSAGTISEGVNYLMEKGFIELDKVPGIRKRFYVMRSIAYSNYLKQCQRFSAIKDLKTNLEQIYQEMKTQEPEFKTLNGFQMLRDWVGDALKLFGIVESGIKLFQKALSQFKPEKIVKIPI
jgi:DNA-binding transcriptional regulator GbsR (MarR family)